MLTRCPACETHFRVTPEQLKARAGRVRCGQCQHVFNALDTLIEEPKLVIATAMPEPAPEQEPAPAVTEEPAADAADIAMDQIGVSPEPTPETNESANIEQPASGMETSAALLAPVIGDTTASETDRATPIVGIQETPIDWSEAFPAKPPPRRWPWVIASLLALAALGLQAALAFRVELAVLMPETRPALVALCDIAGCEVGLPAKVALVGIEASDLYPDPERPGRLVLTATLKNRAPFAQAFPHLELTLTDTADKAVVRKVLAPGDFLPPKIALAPGMPAGADIALTVGVAPGELPASGYRLYLFYP